MRIDYKGRKSLHLGSTYALAAAGREFETFAQGVEVPAASVRDFRELPIAATLLQIWREEEPLTINQAIQWGESEYYSDCAQSFIGYDRNGAIITRRPEPPEANGPYICDTSRMRHTGLQVIVV